MDAARAGYGSAAMIFDKGNGSISYGSHGSGAIVTVDYNAVYASSSTFKPDVTLHGTLYAYANFKMHLAVRRMMLRRIRYCRHH